MRSTTAAVLIAAGIALAGCGGSGAASGSSQPSQASPSRPTVKKDATYGTVAELKDAAVAGGYYCAKWDQNNKVTKAAQSGTCSGQDVFSIYSTTADRDSVVSTMKALTPDDMHLVVGPNWILNAPSPEAWQKVLGGTVVGK